MLRTTIFASLLALMPSLSGAESIHLDAPMHAASLQKGAISMVVYYLEQDDHFEVVATYATKAAPHDPTRLRMGLQDGDATQFSLPGEPHVAYAFSRDDHTVIVEALLSGETIARLDE